MINGYIQLSKALEIMDQVDDIGHPIHFQIRFVTADRANKTGGQIIEVKDARKCAVGNRKGKPVFDTRIKKEATPKISRNPGHWSNSTRNILLANGGVRKVHIRLIIELNNQKVFF
ncbi:MAG: hypothetical protein NT040_11215 [Bacteroidetes bacterium]|nr:hypothetical protein [Bacteroidota bacterium]